MTSTACAKYCGVSQRTLYNLKAKFPDTVPLTFDDAEGWKRVVEANRVTVSTRRHAPRSSTETQSDHSRYIAARARRTESLAESEAIRLAVTKRNMIDRLEV